MLDILSKVTSYATVLFLLCKPGFIQAQSTNHRTQPWSTNYAVDRVEHSNGYTMVVGGFNRVGPYSGSGVFSSENGTADTTFPKVNGTIHSSASDGNGGWYIGGSFSMIDNVNIKNLAHIKSDKTLDINWKPNPTGRVNSIVFNSNTVYIGGTFQKVENQTRNFIAAFDASTGTLKTWDPNCSNTVYALTVNNGIVYAGGVFTSVGGQTRNKVAAISAATGVPTTWDAVIVGTSVNSIAATNSTVYIGGEFTSIGGTPRTSLGAVDASTGALLSWNPNPVHAFATPIINGLLVSANILYVGGKFTGIGGQSIGYLASFDTATGVVNNWNPQVNGIVNCLSLSGTALYAGGQFSSVDGETRQCIASININNATPNLFNPRPTGEVKTISASGTTVFFGGDFSGVSWTDRYGFALFRNATDDLWNFPITLDALGRINTIAVKNNILYIAGQFIEVNGQPRKNIAALDLTNGQLLSWSPSVDIPSAAADEIEIFTSKIKDNLLYIGGRFMEVNGQSRPSLAAIDLTSGQPTNWNPIVGDGTTPGDVYSIDISNNTLYVAGLFDLLGSQSRSNLGAIDITSSSVLTWSPISNDRVRKIRVTETTAYVVGDFIEINTTPRLFNLAAIDLSNGGLTTWNPDFKDGGASDVALTSTDVIVSGYFRAIGTEARNGLASFSQATGLLNSWKPDVGQTEGGSTIYSVDVMTDRILVGGYFNNTGDEARTNYTEYDINVCTLSPIITLNGSTLTSTSGDTYQWYEGDILIDGATSQALDISIYEYGKYSVEVTLGICVERSPYYTYLITGNESEEIRSLVYPNPVHEELNIEVPTDAAVRIVDSMGKDVYTDRLLSSSINRINTSTLIPGLFIVSISSQGKTNHYKIYKAY